MQKRWFAALPAILIGLSSMTRVIAEEEPSQPVSVGPVDYVCPSRLQLRYPDRCPNQGPAGRLTALSIQGLYPPMPLPTARVDPNLGYVPFDYLQVGESGASLYPSVEGAVGHTGAIGMFGEGFVFLAYDGAVEDGGTTIFHTPGGYVRGDQVSQAALPTFHGLAFRRTPDRTFGWVISGGSCTERIPGGSQDFTGHCFTKYDVVQIFDVEHVDDWDWYLVGQDEWIEQRMVAKVDPDLTAPEGVDSDRWITVNLFEQTVAAYDGGQLVYATVASTGRRYNWTQPGLFKVWVKLEQDNMTGGIAGTNFYLLENVPWVLYFDQARALHGTYWHNKFGTPTSRGCVNLSPADAHWFYDFASEGTWVYVWDPSGDTPTDPAAYDAGGA